MKGLRLLFAFLMVAAAASADPIHAVADGAFWHHDSNWIFPEHIGTFTRVGIPQDVAGLPDAVGYYARGENQARTTASVDVYPQDSALSPATLADAKARLAQELGTAVVSEASFAVVDAGRIAGTRLVFRTSATDALTALYFIVAGDWRVAIRINVPDADGDPLPALDAFVRAQRWDTLVGR